MAGLDQLARILSERSSVQLNYSELARDLQVASETANRWVAALEQLHLGFTLRPWSKDIANSLRKEPRWFLRDWSGIEDVGRRAETFVGCHLLKAVEGWTDLGLGTYELSYLRTKQGQEVDFVIIRDRKPWCLVEVKQSASELSPSLAFFQERTKALHAFQVELDAPYEEVDCFAHAGRPVRVPARTFLSQLI
jgi:predicted AAA+ superfamily ATPase